VILLQYMLQLGENKCLMVVFSPINIPKGKFGFSRFFSDSSDNILFLIVKTHGMLIALKR